MHQASEGSDNGEIISDAPRVEAGTAAKTTQERKLEEFICEINKNLGESDAARDLDRPVAEEETPLADAEVEPEQWMEYRDIVPGRWLDPDLVSQAMKEGLE